MKYPKTVRLTALAGLLVAVAFVAHGQGEKSKSIHAKNAPLKAYLGRWDLTMKGAEGEYPSWVELKEENGELKANFVGRWGNARPLPKAELKDGTLTFVSPKQEEALDKDMVFAGKLVGGKLTGTVNGAKGETWTWTGVRAPALKAPANPKWGKPVKLFDGTSLAGWRMMPAGKKPAWTVKDGALVKEPNGPELVNNSKFRNFKLHIEFNCGEESNSGVYLRGRYEVQIENESDVEPPDQHLGGIYGFLAPHPTPPRRPGEWQAYDITLLGRYVTVALNGITIIDNQEIPGITGGALNSDEGAPGPVYLQGSEKGQVLYRNIVLTPAE